MEALTNTSIYRSIRLIRYLQLLNSDCHMVRNTKYGFQSTGTQYDSLGGDDHGLLQPLISNVLRRFRSITMPEYISIKSPSDSFYHFR